MGYLKFASHKTVGAAKITKVEHSADGSTIVSLDGFPDVVIAHELARRKPKPEVGWYFVQYEDGYTSFSPAQAFEEGYTAVSDDEAATPEIAGVLRGDDGKFYVVKGVSKLGDYENADEAFDVADAENAPDPGEGAEAAAEPAAASA